MNRIYHEIETAIYKDRLYAERTLQLALATGAGDYLVEVMINLEDGTCNYLELVPILEKIADVDWFFHDENFILPTDIEPEPDPAIKKSFKTSALKAIENLTKNAHTLASSSLIHRALTSNSTHLIRTTLDLLATECKENDNSLIPILKKIALKNEYKSYFSMIGFQTDCYLNELATSVIQIINKNTHESGNEDGDFFVRTCTVCSSLPDDITVNTGRDFHLPDTINKLQYKGKGINANHDIYRCPGCGTYYERIDTPQMYSSGNLDEERLIRLSWERSHVVDKWFPRV